MEMHQLRYFVAVAQTCSFSRAAERCHVSQPSLSQQIQKLERGLKQQLFERLGRRVVLTDAGRLLLDRAMAILSAVEDAERRLQDDDEKGGKLAIGAIPTIAPYLLPLLLRTYLKRHPHVDLTVHEDVTGQLLGAVAAGDLDLALVACRSTMSAWRWSDCFRRRFFWPCRAATAWLIAAPLPSIN